LTLSLMETKIKCLDFGFIFILFNRSSFQNDGFPALPNIYR
jgi:hypothetical protein